MTENTLSDEQVFRIADKYVRRLRDKKTDDALTLTYIGEAVKEGLKKAEFISSHVLIIDEIKGWLKELKECLWHCEHGLKVNPDDKMIIELIKVHKFNIERLERLICVINSL